jgi:hypothetical protein
MGTAPKKAVTSLSASRTKGLMPGSTLRHRRGLVLGAALMVVAVTPAPAQKPGAPVEAPPMSPLRYPEDYSYLSNRGNGTGAWWERLKFIPLGPSGRTYLTMGDEIRLRYEHYWDDQFGSAKLPTEGYLRFRELPYVGLHVGSDLQIFAQLQGAWGDRATAVKSPFTDQTGLDFLQALVQWQLRTGAERQLTFVAGRQVMVFGSGRLINAGPNIRTSFDGGLARWDARDWRVDVFYVWPVLPGLHSFDDASDHSRRVWSLYATRAFPDVGPGSGLDLFYIGFKHDDAVFNQGQGRERRHTFGSRLFGARNQWAWDLEGDFQIGDFAGGKIRAWSMATEERYTLRRSWLSPWIGLRATAISGDRSPNDPGLQTFNVMFAEGGYFGESGVVGPANLLALHSKIGLDLSGGWSLSFATIFYWRERLGDGLYGLGGELVRPDGGSRSRYIGTQGDVTLSWTVNRNLSFYAAYSTLSPGQFIRDTGPARTVNFLAAHAAYRY